MALAAPDYAGGPESTIHSTSGKTMWKYLILPLCFTTVGAAQTDPDAGFRRSVYSVLRAEFAGQMPVYSNEVLDRLAVETGLAQTEVRSQLGALLDSLEHQRKQKTEVWKTLTQVGGADIPSRAADKLLKNLIKEGRSVLAGQENYLLDKGVRRATRKARLQDFQGRLFILQALDWALAAAGEEAEAEDFGILVSGHTNRFEIHKDPLFIFFDSQDEAYVLEQIREIQRFIIPALVRRLSESASIRWAVRKREFTPLMQPRYHLVFGVDNLSFTGTNRNLRPCVEATIELGEWSTQRSVLTRSLKFCTAQHGSEVTRELDPFYEEVAGKTREIIDEFLTR